MKSDKMPVNREIRSRRVILIDQEGNKKGEFLRDDAISLASEDGLDLVTVSDGDPPICRIMDYGKYLYHQKKKAKNSQSPATKTKEIKFKFEADDNYVNLKTEQARKFLEKGSSVKVTVRFHGRQAAHPKLIFAKCRSVYDSLKEVSEVQSEPKMGGRQVSMLLTPKKEG